MDFHQFRSRAVLAGGLGISQIIAFGTSLYLLAILAAPITKDMGWSLPLITAAMSIGLLASAFISPWIGQQISKKGGRRVLIGSSFSFAIGLAIIGSSHTYLVFVLGWLAMGVGMASGLYDAVFSSIGKIHGNKANPLISAVAIIAGFASTIFWIAGGLMLEKIGWRGVCCSYAAFHLVINIPIYFTVLPSIKHRDVKTAQTHIHQLSLHDIIEPKFLLVTSLFMAEVLVAATMGVHLIYMLVQMGRSFEAAIAIGAILGPSQVAGRVLEMTAGSHIQPIEAAILALCAIIAGLIIMAIFPANAALAMMIYGAGIGVLSIARGTLPLSLFDTEHYPLIIGQMARPVTLAQAAAPTFGAFLIGILSPTGMLLTLAAICSIALCAAVMLAIIHDRET